MRKLTSEWVEAKLQRDVGAAGGVQACKAVVLEFTPPAAPETAGAAPAVVVRFE